MIALLQSLLVYCCIIAVFATMVHSKGHHFDRLAPFEFIFLFMPWLTVIA